MWLSLFCETFFSFSYVCHAEVNAILNRNHASAAGQVAEIPFCSAHIRMKLRLITNCIPCFIFNVRIFHSHQMILNGFLLYLQKLYVTMFPCNECAKLIIQVILIILLFWYSMNCVYCLRVCHDLSLQACICIRTVISL